MPLADAARFTCWLLALSLLIQCAEYLRLAAGPASHQPWQWRIQRDDLRGSAAWIRSLFDRLYQRKAHRMHLLVHTGLAASLIWPGPTAASTLILLGSQTLLLIRWRGAFNGGSDFMTLAVMLGVVIGSVATPLVGESLAWQAGLWAIAIQTLTSYFLSGTVKLKYAGWRNGRALPALLGGGLYGPLAADSVLRGKFAATLASWAFIVWEALFPLAMVHPSVITLWCMIGVFFHFLVFWYFSLNRFFWAWIATYPALIACAGLLGS